MVCVLGVCVCAPERICVGVCTHTTACMWRSEAGRPLDSRMEMLDNVISHLSPAPLLGREGDFQSLVFFKMNCSPLRELGSCCVAQSGLDLLILQLLRSGMPGCLRLLDTMPVHRGYTALAWDQELQLVEADFRVGVSTALGPSAATAVCVCVRALIITGPQQLRCCWA